MELQQALENALEFLESLGYGTGGDIHDDLKLAISRLRTKYPKATREVL